MNWLSNRQIPIFNQFSQSRINLPISRLQTDFPSEKVGLSVPVRNTAFDQLSAAWHAGTDGSSPPKE